MEHIKQLKNVQMTFFKSGKTRDVSFIKTKLKKIKNILKTIKENNG